MYFIYSETEQDWCAEFNVIFTAAENPNTDGGGGGITLNISRNFAGHSLRRGVKKQQQQQSQFCTFFICYCHVEKMQHCNSVVGAKGEEEEGAVGSSNAPVQLPSGS